MTLVREYQPTFVLGDGVTKEFSYLFEEVSENFIKVIVKHDDESTYVPVYSVDLDSHKVVFGDSEPAPLDTDVICIYRETPDLQDTPFRTLQGYDARALENILTKIVAMIQELKANGFSTQILQGYPWQLDLLNPVDDSASVVIDYNARILKKGLYFRIQGGNLQVSSDGSSFITMPKSADVAEFRQVQQELPDHTIVNRLEYRVGSTWFAADPSVPVNYGASFEMAMDASTFVISATLKDQNGNTLGTTQTVDLPLESVVVGGSYDDVNKQLILLLENGNTIEIPVADLVDGLQETLVSGVNIKTINNNSILGSGNLTIDSLPTQTGNSGKFLTTDGTDASWATVDALPTQTGQNGKFLTTDGSSASWGTVDALPTQTGNNGKYLTTNGSSASWGSVDSSPTSASTNLVTSGGVYTAVNAKQDTLVSGTNIKTINSGSILGSGNIDVLVNEATATNALGVGYTTINTTYNDSINIGNASQVLANNAIALGAFASAEGQDSIAIYSSTGTAHRARTTHTGNIAIGYNALAINAAYTIAIGYNASAQSTNAIQLGTGQNASSGTMQVWTYKLLDKTSGLIPAARFADQTSATQGQVLTLDSNLDAQWATINTMTGASAGDAGTSGLVPTPAAGDQAKFLQGDGTWANPTAATAWGNITGTLSNQTDLQNALDSKANTDLSNLTSTGANIGNWSHNVSNCITEIPQDIKLELNNGTLTLKAGSKVYVPNGFEADGVTPKYDTITIASDTVLTSTWGTAEKVVIFVNKSDNSLYMLGLVRLSSGASAPTETNMRMWYDTTNNLVKRYAGGADTGDRYSFPITICTKTSANEDTILNTIDQIFNGFGYIGSTVFALPGVKGLAPNGRNNDGTCRNIERIISSVKIMSMAPFMTDRLNSVLTIDSTGNLSGQNIDNRYWGTINALKDLANVYKYYSCWYCVEDNKMHYFDANQAETTPTPIFVGSFDVDSNNKISLLGIKQPFHAVDYNDTEFIGHQAMPSNQYVGLTVGASGSSYVAPADGYFVVAITDSGYAELTTTTTSSTASFIGGWARAFIPVKKGTVMVLYYGNVGTWKLFMFVYAQGAQ